MLRGIPRVTTDYLHFYFVGGCEPSTTSSEGNTTDFTVSIANQSSKLPILSYGPAGDQISILSDKNSKKRFTTDSGGVTIPDYQWSDNWGSGGTGQSWDPAAPLAYAVTEGDLNTPFKQKTKSNVTFEAGKIYDLGDTSQW